MCNKNSLGIEVKVYSFEEKILLLHVHQYPCVCLACTSIKSSLVVNKINPRARYLLSNIEYL